MEIEKLIARINELARKKKAEGLTDDEAKEQAALREEYLGNIRAQFTNVLDRIEIVEPDGTRTKPRKKQEVKKQ